MSNRRLENSKTLASLLGISESDAATQLDIAGSVTVDPADAAGVRLANMLELILGRTLARVRRNDGYEEAAVEIVIGAATSKTATAHRVVVTESKTRIGKEENVRVVEPAVHPILLLIAACYAAGRAMKIIFDDRLRINATPLTDALVLPHRSFAGDDVSFLRSPIHLSDTYLAGAGAIGNGVAFALSLLDVYGELVILDPDTVGGGNLNRCLLFTEDDVDAPKASRLAEILEKLLPRLKVTGHRATLQDYGTMIAHNPWLKRLIVAVDSPRGRRQLQGEIPREVFDASTTGVVEVVFHHHVQPTDAACLACVYHETPNEQAHELHIAEQLGLALADVQAHFITPESASKIIKKYPDLTVEELAGTAVDSLFKALCGEAKLQAAEGRQVLAPFAFVSVLASAVLVIELARRLALGPDSQSFNHWRLNPWMPPVEALKRLQPRRADCEFCREPALLRAAKKLWT